MPFYNKKHGIFYTVPCFYFYQLYAKLLNILDKKEGLACYKALIYRSSPVPAYGALSSLFFKFLTACGFSPLQIVALRVLFAAVLMTAVIFKIDPKLLKICWRDSWLFIGTGIFSLVFFNYCYFRSIESSSISIAVLLLYTAPVFVMLLSIFLFREKFTRCKMLALLSTFCGCTFITGIFSSKMTLTLEAFGFGLALVSVMPCTVFLVNWH